MKLTIADVLGNLAAAELSHLALFEDGPEIPINKFNLKLLPLINAGLIDIHTRFFVKQKEIWVKYCHGDTRLVLDRKNTASVHSLRGGSFIQDCEDPFYDDVVEILSVYNESGMQFPLNQDDGYAQSKPCGCRGSCSHGDRYCGNKYENTLDIPNGITTVSRCRPYGSGDSSRSGLPGLFTPAMNIIKLPDGMGEGFLRVIYKAAPRRIKPLEDNGVTTYDRIMLDLPASYLNALVFYLASRLTAPTNGGLQGQTNETLKYYNQYLAACALLQDQGIDVSTTASGVGRFNQSGFP